MTGVRPYLRPSRDLRRGGRRWGRALTPFFLLLLAPSNAGSQVKLWVGPAADPQWCDPDNWNPAGKPTSGDTADLTGAGVPVEVQSCAAEADSIDAPDGLLVHGELVLGTGGNVHGLVVNAGANHGPNLGAGAQLEVTGAGELIDGEIQGPGTMDNQGLFVLRDGAVLSTGLTLLNNGTLQVLGDVSASGGATVVNATPQAIEVTLSAGAGKSFGPDLSNTGSVSLEGPGNMAFAGEWTDSGGEITIDGAGLSLTGGGTFDASSFGLGAGAVVDVGNPIQLYGAHFSGVGTFRVFQSGAAGTVLQNVVSAIGAASAGDKGLLIGDDVTIGEDAWIDNLADGLLTLEGFPIFLRGGADPSRPATLINRGRVALASTTNLDATVIRNLGVWEHQGTLNLSDLADFDELVNEAGGTIQFIKGRINNGSASIRNQGRFVAEPLAGDSVEIVPLYRDAGETIVRSGTLKINGQMIRDGSGTTTVNDGATLWVVGGFEHGDADSTSAMLESTAPATPAAALARASLPPHVMTSTLVDRARIAPGGAGAVGTFILDGNLQAGSTSRLCIDIAGPLVGEVDNLTVLGDVALAGGVKVSVLGGFEPPPGTEFEILTATAGGVISGAFTGVEGLGTWSLSTYADRVVLTVVETPPPAIVFEDGFEGSDTSAWSSSTGE